MEGNGTLLAGSDVCALFGELLVPRPHETDAYKGTFVVNRQAGRRLCCLLQGTRFFALSGDVQLQIVSLLDVGLVAGHCSAVRLRLSCEGGQLIGRLVELLKALTARVQDKESPAAEQDSGLIDVVGRVLGMVCSAGIGVPELKGLLHELRVPSALTPPLLSALSVMARTDGSYTRTQSSGNSEEADHHCCEVVESIFDFGGEGAGLALPVARWPFPQEYQLVAWVRVEESAAFPAGGANLSTATTRAHLVTFTTEMGAGVDYYIQDSRLFVAVADGGGVGPVQPTVVDMGAAGLSSGRWHALVISHRRSSTLLFNKDQLEVFVDGQLFFSAPVPYPRRISEPLARCSIGWSLDGQTSGVLLLSGVASLKTANSMLKRLAGRPDDVTEGADAFGNSSPDLDLWDDTTTASAQQRLKRKLLGAKYRIVAALLPNRTVDGLCLEPHNALHGLLRGSRTHAWMTHSVQDVIRSIGGTPSLLSLANELLAEPGLSFGRKYPSSFIGRSVDTVLSILLSFLDGNVANQADFFFAGGVEILQLLLSSAPKVCFSSAGTHTVMVLERILQACRSHRLSAYIQQALPGLAEDAYRPEAGISSLEHQILACLLANFPLWARAPPEFQFGLVTSVLDVVRDGSELCRQSLPLELVLASVRVCCPDQIPGGAGRPLDDQETGVSGFMSSETTSESSAGASETSSHDQDWTSMARRERLHMRGFLWELVRLLLGREVLKQDGDALVHFLASCDDTRLVCELVQVLSSLMRKSTPPAGLFSALENASCVHEGVEHRQRGSKTSRPLVPHSGFLSLVLERCVLVNGASEDLRVAGLRAANVFMARSAKANERDAVAAGGEGMDAKVSSVFPLLSEGLVRDRHILGEATYAALLEMALLGDERDLPWAEQDHVVGIVGSNSRIKRRNNNDLGSEESPLSGEMRTEDEDLAAGVWWDCDSQDGGARGGTGHVLDDAQLIRNVLPLALILQYLPTMANSVQVRSHGDLLLMLKLNEANRQKVMELSHVHNGKFWGIWERCMFLMMAPLFSRGILGHEAESDRQDGNSQDGERKGDYFMVLRLYAILLEHAMCFDGDGYKEIAVATSLQHLIPHGRIAVRVLLAQLAFEVGQNPEPFLQAESSSDSSSDASDPESEQEVRRPRQPRWDNMVHLAFIAANIVSDDVSTVTLGLFPEGEGVKGLPEDEPDSEGNSAAIRASAASASVPFLLCSNPAGHASLALSARVLGMFGVLSGGASMALIELCAARSAVSGQGPLMFPLLRLSVFLLVRLHPFTKPAQENLERFASLVQCLLSDGWSLKEEIHAENSDSMGIVVLAHVHAALLRLKALALTVGGTSHRLISEARKAVAGENFTSSSVRPLVVDATAAYEYGRTLHGLLRYIILRRRDLLSTTLGEPLVGALQTATTFEPQEAFGIPDRMDADNVTEQHADQARRCWDHLLQSLKWMEGSLLFSSAEETSMRAKNGVAAFLEACVPSLKAAEQIESQAVREAGERTRQWRELENRTAPGGEVVVAPADGTANQVLETKRQEALNAEALRKMKTGCRLLACHRRLQCYLSTLCAAWSPWAAGDTHGGNEPRGWEVSSHKDQLMRQMLLVPVDTDVGHAGEAYAGPSPRPSDGDAHQNPAMMSGVQPSKSLLAGVDFNDDDDEVTDGEVENDQSSAAAESFGHVGASAEPAEWEHIPPPGALQVESIVSVQSIASQQEQENVKPASTGGCASSQRLFGKWRANNVLRQGSVQGILYMFEESLVFESERNEIEDSEAAAVAAGLRQHAGQTWRWRLGRLTQLHLRRFLLSPQAVELFWADSPEVFLAFEDVTARQAFTRHLRRRNLPMLPVMTRQGILHPRKVLKACRLTESWRRRQISNFQYIMALNVIAGRSFNDISQYPVFPWVLADYTSSELDLNNPASFRDLSKPVGALNEERRRLFLERYASFEDEMVPKFMYGTHYSSAGVVLHYLVRQDPFTTLHVNLQGGRFDCPDRLFHDMDQSWKGCADGNSMSDVKELTPEFFYSPEIFLNSNNLPLGEMQGGKGAVDDVRLPPWAKDAFDFVRIHRLALESEHVSKHLHRWVDLIFGYQQRGDEAVKAANVFYYLTYEGAVDLSLVKDARQREAMEAQIHHFGQTPSQILKEPHPIRLPLEECVLPIFSPTSTVDCLRVFSAGNRPPDPCRAAALLVYCTLDRLVSVDATLRVTTWRWSGVPDGFGLPFTLGSCRTNFLPSRSLHMSSVSTRTSTSSGQVPTTRALPPVQDPSCQAAPLTGGTEEAEEIKGPSPASSGWRLASSDSVASVSPNWKEGTPAVSAPKICRVHSSFGLCTASPGSIETILSCGYWDNVVRVHRVNSAVKLPLEGSGTGGHRGAISCLAIAQESSLLVTGGEDATCRVWVVGNPAMASALGGTSACDANATKGTSSRDSMACVHVLYGHEAPVTCLAVSEELDAVVSGSSDGRIVLHCLKDGSYVRQYRCGLSVTDDAVAPIPASQLVFSCHGDVVAHSWADCSLHRFSLNGTRLATTFAPTGMNCLLTAGEGDNLLAGGQDGLIRVYTLHDLCVLHTIDLQHHGGVTCMRLSPNDEYLLAGSQDGEVSIITDARKRMRMLDLALRKAFVG